MVLSSIPFVGFSLPSSQPFYEANSLTCSLSQRVDSGSPELAKSCFCCRRRRFLQSASMATTLFPIVPSTAAVPRSNYTDVLNKFHPPKPGWYEELYASVLKNATKSYEAEVARYKAEIFSNLREKAHKILEIGIGTGPNLSYYASNSDVQVVGIDPNQKMEKYARSSAVSAGLPPSNFEFIHAVGEVIPLDDASVDAVVGTLVLCSVKDVSMTLQEIKRVLRPGGLYVIVEHVGAKEGTILRFIQRILDPLQQVLADGCHLCRDTESLISEAGFSRVELNTASLKKASFVNPHIYGLAYK
ncbi:methyltransferase-like protein 7A isoform X1 [Neltuma alba]|uniref:methyltransferase-like protein 7A isoform X1 n=1 Tax=Neltuma alba TaxID=207710 RepID=UPI0010A49CBD|nr:methyltransferase-like protein 7A isoform X1 [Prosopis alba]XP_028762016.1 methyltransferase-like protein 7A isoform X1 [Prosopis alba]